MSNVFEVRPEEQRFVGVFWRTQLTFEVRFAFGSATPRECVTAFPFRYQIKREDGRTVGFGRYLLVILPDGSRRVDVLSRCSSVRWNEGSSDARSPARMITVRKRWARRAGLGLVVLAACWFTSGVIAGTLLTRRARPAFEERPPPGYRGVHLRSQHGEDIGAWLATRPSDDIAVVMAHGNGSSRTALLDQANDLHARGCTVMPISLRAHGDSSGERNDIGWSARHDVAAAAAYLRAQAPERPVILMGTSLGAAAAIFAGSEEHVDASAYVLIGAFADLRGAVRRRTRRYLPPPLSWFAYEALLAAAPIVLPELDSIAPAAAAAKLPHGTRALLLVGGEDDRATLEDANAIAANIPGAHVVVLDGIGHDDLSSMVHEPAWSQSLDALLASLRH